MNNEVWKQIPGYEGSYEASSAGRIKSVDRIVGGGSGPRVFPGRIRKQSVGGHGYRVVSLSLAGKVKVYCVHALVLMAFFGMPLDGQEACHKNGNREENSSENLRWGTRLSNIQDKKIHGTQLCGDKVHLARLSEVDVIEIKSRLKDGESQTALAHRYGVAVETVHSIKSNRSWRHV